MTWSDDGHSYVIMDDGSVYDTKGTTVIARMAAGTPKRQYQEVADPRNWQWFGGFGPGDRPTWVSATAPNLARNIR
ncbi:MAG TPA: hypothetical protein VG206_08540 [Terriglobia bacterium]|nr:hypothetical protein [Terriglobia bacterium]